MHSLMYLVPFTHAWRVPCACVPSCGTQLRLARVQEVSLKDEIRRLDAQSRDASGAVAAAAAGGGGGAGLAVASGEYLRNVVAAALSPTTGAAERARVAPVIGALLGFSDAQARAAGIAGRRAPRAVTAPPPPLAAPDSGRAAAVVVAPIVAS
jgi:hypothetical protein